MRLFLKVIFSISLIIISLIIYLSLVGIETSKFNKQISNSIKNIDKNLDIELKKIKIILNPFNLNFSAKTIGPKIINKEIVLEFESIETNIPFKAILAEEFLIENMIISTRSLNLKKVISFSRSFKKNLELLFLESFVKNGFLIAKINLNFDQNGKVKDNYKINGVIRDAKIDVLKKYKIDKFNFKFDIDKEKYDFRNINLLLNKSLFSSEKIVIKNINESFLINGEFENKKIDFSQEQLDLFLKPITLDLDIKNLEFSSKNNFNLKIDKKFNLNNFELDSKINLTKLSILSSQKLKKLFPELNKNLELLNNEILIKYKKNDFYLDGSGDILLQSKNDKIKYSINKKKNIYNFLSILEIRNNPVKLDFLDYEKNEDSTLSFTIEGLKKLNGQTKFNLISLNEKENTIKIENLILNKENKITNLDYFNIDIVGEKNNINKFNIIQKNKNYYLRGPIFNADKIIRNFLDDDDDKSTIIKKSFKIYVDVEKFVLDKEYSLSNFNGSLLVQNQEILDGNLIGLFDDKKKLTFTVKSINNQKITTLFLDKANAIVKRYKFIKGFNGGLLDFYSVKEGKESVSSIKIYDFKLNELPVLTKLLTLASLQGIADLLSGEGISFDEFEMKFQNKDNTMIIDEIYAIGPAISILMNGYIEKNKLISLRGTLVPATTINKVIGSIPVLGQILVGSETGEGVFGVSFKVKGPPNNLETTVNPIKTLTPRFITRTLEKITKN